MVDVNDRPEMSNEWETQGRKPGMMVRFARRSRSPGLSSPYLHNNETSCSTQPPRSVFFHVQPVPSLPERLASSRSSFTSSGLKVFLHFQPGPSLLHFQTAVTALPFRCLTLARRKFSASVPAYHLCSTMLFCPQVGNFICCTSRIAVKCLKNSWLASVEREESNKN